MKSPCALGAKNMPNDSIPKIRLILKRQSDDPHGLEKLLLWYRQRKWLNQTQVFGI
jgi:hypothetical protein